MPSKNRRKRENDLLIKEDAKKCRKITSFFSGTKDAVPADKEVSYDEAVQSESKEVNQSESDSRLTTEENKNIDLSECTIFEANEEPVNFLNCADNLEADDENYKCGNENDNIENNKLAKSETNATTKSKHKVAFDTAWVTEFPWVKHSVDSETNRDVLLCDLCCKYHKENSPFRNSQWVNRGILTIRLDKVKEHSKSEMHNLSVAEEANAIRMRERSEKHLTEGSELFQAVTCAMKCLDFLVQHNLPLTTLYQPFIKFCTEELQSPKLAPLNKAKNAKYTSYLSINELLDAMAKEKEEELLKDINSSPYFSILTDETTDINNRKHMAVVAKYLKDGKPHVSLVKDCHLPDGKSDTIYSELTPIIEQCGNFEKMSGFTSDGASAMIGANQGVLTKVKQRNEKIIGFNCMNHRLALATKDTFESMSRFVRLDEILTSVYKYYKNSSSRTNSLMTAQALFGTGETTIKRAGFTRWLSHNNAVNSIRINYKSILMDLENTVANGENSRISGPTASGLLKHFKSYDFFRCIHFLCDILGVITNLNLIFQKADVDLAAIEPSIENTKSQLQKLKRKPGGTFSKKIADRARELGINAPIGEPDSSFENDARDFIDRLLQNISKRTENQCVVTQLGILDLSRVGEEEGLISLYGNSEMIDLAEYFGLDEDETLEEWSDFKTTFLSRTDFPAQDLKIQELCTALWKAEKSTGKRFPIIQNLLNVACTLAISNAEVERIFSQVRNIITDKRNRIKMENINKILLLKINSKVDFINSVNRWKSIKNRRIFM